MNELLSHASSLAVQIFAIASMTAVGIRYTLRDILEPLRNVRGVILALVANFLAVPLLAWVILRLLSLERSYGIGLVLVASAAGAPFVIKLTKISGGSVAFAAGLLVLLLVVSIGYMPLVVPQLTTDVTVSTWAIAAPLVMTMLLPLVVGLIVDRLSPRITKRVLPALLILSNVALVVLVVVTFLLHVATVRGVFGTGAILASVLLLLGAFAIGWLLGGFGEHLDDEMAFGTAQRNYAAAMVVASQSFGDPGVLVMVVVVSLVSMAVLFPAAKLMGRHVARRSAAAA
jgi:BASS family bile acid:Na+ symporter